MLGRSKGLWVLGERVDEEGSVSLHPCDRWPGMRALNKSREGPFRAPGQRSPSASGQAHPLEEEAAHLAVTKKGTQTDRQTDRASEVQPLPLPCDSGLGTSPYEGTFLAPPPPQRLGTKALIYEAGGHQGPRLWEAGARI